MSDETIETVIAPVLRESFGHHGLEGFAVRAGEDHDGDPVLFVSIRFGSAATMPAGDETTGAMVAIRRLLLAILIRLRPAPAARSAPPSMHCFTH